MRGTRIAFDPSLPVVVTAAQLVWRGKRWKRGDVLPWRDLKVTARDLLRLWAANKIDCRPADIDAATPMDFSGLRTDGPTLEEWTAADAEPPAPTEPTETPPADHEQTDDSAPGEVIDPPALEPSAAIDPPAPSAEAQLGAPTTDVDTTPAETPMPESPNTAPPIETLEHQSDDQPKVDAAIALEFKGSSNVRSADLDVATGIVTVAFANGTTYRYQNFTSELMSAWQQAASAGGWFHQNVKKQPDKHPIERAAPTSIPSAGVPRSE